VCVYLGAIATRNMRRELINNHSQSALVSIVISAFAWTAAGAAPPQETEQEPAGNHASRKYTLKLETTQHKQYCQANASIEYVQNDDVANVSGEIKNEDCAASGGEFTINVRYRDSDGELQDINFAEIWQREDDRPIAFEREYLIGKNVDLIRVRTRKLNCTCAEIPGENKHEVLN